MNEVLAAAALLSAALLGVVAVPLGLMAAAVSGNAAALLAAAAAVSLLLPRHGRLAALLALPGAVAATAVASDAVVFLLVATAVVLAAHESASPRTLHPLLLVPAAWLLLAPTTLPGIDDVGLGPYQAGVIRAVPVAVAAVAAGLRWRGTAP